MRRLFPQSQDSYRFSDLEGGSHGFSRSLGGALTIPLTLNTLAFAQGTADIVGRVTDTSGAVLPAVTVTAENIATKNVRTTVTSDTGDYVFTLLPIGIYTVKIELQGFQPVNSRVELATGDRARVDAPAAARDRGGEPSWSRASPRCCRPIRRPSAR